MVEEGPCQTHSREKSDDVGVKSDDVEVNSRDATVKAASNAQSGNIAKLTILHRYDGWGLS